MLAEIQATSDHRRSLCCFLYCRAFQVAGPHSWNSLPEKIGFF